MARYKFYIVMYCILYSRLILDERVWQSLFLLLLHDKLCILMHRVAFGYLSYICLLYTSDAADE